MYIHIISAVYLHGLQLMHVQICVPLPYTLCMGEFSPIIFNHLSKFLGRTLQHSRCFHCPSSVPGRVLSKITLGRQLGLVSIAKVIVKMRN